MGIPSRAKRLSVAQQFLFLKNSAIVGGSGVLSNGKLSWYYTAQPTPISREYDVQIELTEGDTPNVIVLKPDLNILAEGRELPHVYHDPLRLCLYLPRKQQWHKGLRLDETIVPWTLLWLHYFEEWLATDEWKGGGEHPNPDANIEGNRKVRRMSRKL